MTVSRTTLEAADDDLGGKAYDSSWFGRPLISIEEFVANGAGVFESDDEVDEFIAWIHAERRRDMA
jgi:hypothetical protein